jgi:hypothetical protein
MAMTAALARGSFTRRRRALIGLTLCCVAAHAAVLAVATAASPRPQAAVAASAASLSVRSIDVVVPMPVATPPAPAAPAFVPVPKVNVASRTAPAAIEAVAPTHLAAEGLDMPPMPRSAPDASVVEGVAHSGMPIRLRLYIDADGTVSDIELQFAQVEDEPAAQRLADMFRATGFLPGRLNGRDVASFLDVEIDALPQALSARAD